MRNPADTLVVMRAIERMRHRAHELNGGLARELRVAVERDDVLHARQVLHWPDDRLESVRLPAHRRVELFELAALALPSHENAFLGIPPARPVKEEETPATSGVRVG